MAPTFPRSRVRWRRLGAVGLLGAGALLVPLTLPALEASELWTGGPTNDASDPRNRTRGKIGGPADCLAHHGPGAWASPMTDSHVLVPLFPEQIDVGVPRPLRLQVLNPWRGEVSALRVWINLTGPEPLLHPAQGVGVRAVPDAHHSWNGTLAHPVSQNVSLPDPLPSTPPSNRTTLIFQVGPDVVSVEGHLQIWYPEDVPDPPDDDQLLAPLNESFQARLYAPGRSSKGEALRPIDANATQRAFRVHGGEANRSNPPLPGPWRVELAFDGGEPSASYFLEVVVKYRAVGANEFLVYEALREPPDAKKAPRILIPVYKSLELPPIEVIGVAQGTQRIEVRVEARLWHRHSSNAENEDVYDRWATLNVTIGDRYVPSTASGIVVQREVDYLPVTLGEIAGFASAVLLVPALVLGGAYGRTSRRLFNLLLGGARRRVMFHNLLSLGLIVAGLLHAVVFLLEPKYSVLKGILWGGLGAVSLLVLGLTGYYQVPLVQKYGFRAWRRIHVAASLLVLAFVAAHALADGEDFFTLKERLPEWVQNLNWSQI